MYHERSLVSVHTTPGGAPVAALAFGRYAREDNTLVTVLRGGGIDIKVRRQQTPNKHLHAVNCLQLQPAGACTQVPPPITSPPRKHLRTDHAAHRQL